MNCCGTTDVPLLKAVERSSIARASCVAFSCDNRFSSPKENPPNLQQIKVDNKNNNMGCMFNTLFSLCVCITLNYQMFNLNFIHLHVALTVCSKANFLSRTIKYYLMCGMCC